MDDTLYRQIFARHPGMLLLVDRQDGRIVEANHAAAIFLGREPCQLRGMALEDVIGTEDAHATTAPGQLDRTDGSPAWFHWRDAAGNARLLETDSAPIAAGSGRYRLLTLHDVTDRAGYQAVLEDYRTFFDQVPVAFYRATPGPAGRFLRINPAMARLFGAESPAELMERTIASLYIRPEDRSGFSDAMLRNGRVVRHEMDMRTLNDRRIRVADTAYVHHDEDGHPVFDGVLEDITRQCELEAELARQASHDDLTGLYNRRGLDALLHREIGRAERHGQPCSGLMLDLDRFKAINDRQGHAIGDAVLAQIGAMVRQILREGDVAGRWGGEEFIVVLPDTDHAGVLQLAERLRAAMGEATWMASGPVTVSIGCGTYIPGEGETRFVARLDGALYAAKHAGRNRVLAAPGDGSARKPAAE